MSDLSNTPLSLYVHLPWCVRKCPYCDFNSHRAPESLPIGDYVRALLADLDRDLTDYPALTRRSITSVFFGGGTPSLFPPAAIADILNGAHARLRFGASVEITLEANPGTTEHGLFEVSRQAGVNRFSLGVQSFDEAMLRRLGRIHSAGEARRAALEVVAAGFDELNLDLMYALPDQDLAGALRDVETAIELAPTHLSHYQLTIEPHTEFAARPPALPDDELAFAMMRDCQTRLAAAGYRHYETSAYARPGHECRHNLNYWRFGDYLGIGAGAHGKFRVGGDIRRRWKHKHPRLWLTAAGEAAAIGGDEALAPGDLPFEFAMNALRLHEGFALAEFEQATGQLADTLDGPLRRATERGLVEIESGRVFATELGRRFLNDLLTLFLP